MKEKLHRLNVRSVMQALISLLSSPAKRHRQLNTLPRCMRPDGDGAKRPTTGAEAGGVVGASAAGVAMLRALISMRTSIARGAVGRRHGGPQVIEAPHCV